MKTEYSNIKALLIFLLVLFLIYGYQWYQAHNIKMNYCKTLGELTYYSNFDAEYKTSLEYLYRVDSIEYKRMITLSDAIPHFSNCLGSCGNMKFIVIYSKNDPSKSLVYLHKYFFENIEVDTIRINLDDFE